MQRASFKRSPFVILDNVILVKFFQLISTSIVMSLHIRLLFLLILLSAILPVSANELDVVVVSATRSPLSINQAPSNIAVLDGTPLSTTQAEHAQQLLSQVPGVNLQRGDGQESLPGIRSAVLTGAGACGSVLIMEEGIPVRGPAFCNVNELFDTHFEQAQQIEITRGPSTAFYGSNSLTGSINVSLPHAGRDFVAFEAGEESYRRFKGAVSYGTYGAKSDPQGRINLTLTDTDAFRNDSGYRQQKLSWRHQQNIGSWQVNAGLTGTKLDQETAGFIIGADSYRDLNLAQANPNPEAFRDTESLRAWARFSRETQNGYRWQVTPYARTADMDFRLHFLPGDPLEQNRQTGVGWQTSLSRQANDYFSWAVGFDADFSQGELAQTQDQATQGSAFLRATIPVGVQYDYQVQAQQVGTFAHADWQLSPELSAQFGLRAEYLEYDYDNLALDGRTREDGTECGFGGCRYSRPSDREDSFSNLSPKLELRYDVNDRLRFFAAAASSFRAPQATELYRLQRAQQVADLDSVRASNLELGVTYRSEKVAVVANLYQLNTRNVIIRDSDFFNVDGSRIDSKGLELSLKMPLLPTLGWRLSGAFSEHKYASDQLSGGVNINNNDVDTAPKQVINMALKWQPVDEFWADLELQHVSDYFLEPENRREYPGHTVYNLRAAYQVSPKLSVSARVLNVSDIRYAERADFTTFSGERYFPGLPRTVYVGVRYDFTKSVVQ